MWDHAWPCPSLELFLIQIQIITHVHLQHIWWCWYHDIFHPCHSYVNITELPLNSLIFSLCKRLPRVANPTLSGRILIPVLPHIGSTAVWLVTQKLFATLTQQIIHTYVVWLARCFHLMCSWCCKKRPIYFDFRISVPQGIWHYLSLSELLNTILLLNLPKANSKNYLPGRFFAKNSIEDGSLVSFQGFDPTALCLSVIKW